ncbi:putative molybdenum cofactor sulfurtransferase [Lupinus albus]|uniref:Putative molybdenum cofactor sulfurtransferase n=1 Tax=Lupinus albus TaxID=3870 RepID=A0A6A4NX28_LUPAL|nr:putative molybdenum cofactor sulfurtransferase [Lupinus albus]
MGASSSSSSSEPVTPTAQVSAIFIYPIKSCRGISVPSAPLTPTGLRWDRQWVVVNSKGRACTQRVEPGLALIEVELPTEAFDETWEPTNDSYMVLEAPGMQPLKVCLNKQHGVTDGISVWEWSGSAWDEGAEASQWFSDYLGKPSRLVRFNTASEVRPVDPDYVKEHQIMFSDGYPFLVISQESLNALNQLLKEPLPINRFRPNFLVEGCEPFSEDLWQEIDISRFSFLGVKLCSRCKIPSIDQDTGISGPEPNETLMRTRSDKVIRPNGKQKSKFYFGQNLVWNWKDSSAKGNGKIINVGDPVYVHKKVSSADEAAA